MSSSRAVPANTQRTGSQVLLETLHEKGVEVCFANPGTTEMWLVAALDAIPGIRPVLGLHETVCAGAADGYARVARKPACTLLHLGVGLANALANLHNARRANSPVLNIVGDMSTWHRGADSALETDIEAIAKTVSAHVHTSVLPGAIRGDTIEALKATDRSQKTPPGGKGRVSTLIVPHDRSWEGFGTGADERGEGTISFADSSDDEADESETGKATSEKTLRETTQTTNAFLALCAEALVETQKGKVALYVGGEALLAADGALQALGAVAGILGAELLCENAFARVDRGNDLPHPKRLAYFPKDAARELARFDLVACVDVKRPIAMFGYNDSGPSHLLRLEESKIWDLDVGGGVLSVADVAKSLLDAVAKKLGRSVPGTGTAYWTVPPRAPPALPFGMDLDNLTDDGVKTSPPQKLTPNSMCEIIAALQPANCVVVDESLTSGTNYWNASAGCLRFQHLTLTGGAIGFGPCASVGAAVALEWLERETGDDENGNGRYVINIQADGCAAYAPQALWTQAKENLNVITIVCANRKYQILELESLMQKTGTGGPGGGGAASAGRPHSNRPSPHEKASVRLTSLTNPHVEWVAVANGFGVFASQCSTPTQFAGAFKQALRRKGPTLIEALL